VLIRSADGPLVTYIDGSGVRRVVKGTASSTQNSWTEHTLLLEGFTIQNGKHSGPGGVAYVKLRNCILSNNIALNMTAVSYAAHMENCLIVGNVASNASHKTDGILFAKTDLINCTVVGNKCLFADGANVMNGGSFANCVVYGNEFGSTLLSQSGTTASHTSFEYPLQGEGNIILSTSPFADAANGDYRLRADSSCIDAGASGYATCASDIAGNPRIKGRSIDMGCYEFQTVRTETMTTPIPVPYVWLEKYPSIVTASAQEADHEAAAKETAANGVNKIWECYVAGLVPTNATDVFRTVILFVDGKPIVSWEPDLNENGAKHERVYRVLGAKALGGLWDDVTDIADPGAAGYRFFKATVTMP
jgi:hypothetical protein